MSPTALPTIKTSPLVLALMLAWPALAQQRIEPPPLRNVPQLGAPPSGEASRSLPIILRADEIRGQPDLETVASGNVEFRRGGVVIRADELSYDHPQDLARARGSVRISRDGNIYTGREMQLRVQRFEGFFLDPTYFFSRTGAGGRAERIDFIDEHRSRAIGATYTSCPADSSGGPDWLLETSRVKLDFEANEGIAEGAVLRFLGVPILGAPVLSFPLSDARKSGWLPPSINLDSKSGFEFSLPYYWNIAPQRDATFAPAIVTRRGFALESEFRYLDPAYRGESRLHLLPNDRVFGRTRHALRLRHAHELPRDVDLSLNLTRASDDVYWKDFPRVLESLTPRLLANDGLLRRHQQRSFGDLSWYGRVQRWQVLRDPDPVAGIVAPYERSPQVGVRLASRLASGFELAAETEINRFTLPAGEPAPARPTGSRVHALGTLSWPWRPPGGWFTPMLTLNAASYRLDGPAAGASATVSRTIPTFGIDSGLVFERDSVWFGRGLRQTLEPRLLFVATPLHDQSRVPNFDAAAKDFNFDTIYTDNAFSGIDRVSDALQLSAGLTTRLLDPATGSEALRLGVVQRFQFRDQQVTPEGVPFTQRFSDVLLLGSTHLVPRWTLDAAVQYSPDLGRTVRSSLGARYSPGPFRTVSASYRLTRSLTEQVEMAWQWPIAGRVRDPDERPRASPFVRALDGGAGGKCDGAWYSVGRVSFSTRDKRITDSVAGLEYDAGCWIGRVVAERLSTGRSEATTRLLLQLELVGLSRLGSNPLSVLKDNIPGYRLLRDDRRQQPAPLVYD